MYTIVFLVSGKFEQKRHVATDGRMPAGRVSRPRMMGPYEAYEALRMAKSNTHSTQSLQ